MRRVIFGSACMISGLLLVIIMMFIGTFDFELNFWGNCILWAGVVISVFGAILGFTYMNGD